jgi:hypothetical protein
VINDSIEEKTLDIQKNKRALMVSVLGIKAGAACIADWDYRISHSPKRAANETISDKAGWQTLNNCSPEPKRWHGAIARRLMLSQPATAF